MLLIPKTEFTCELIRSIPVVPVAVSRLRIAVNMLIVASMHPSAMLQDTQPMFTPDFKALTQERAMKEKRPKKLLDQVQDEIWRLT